MSDETGDKSFNSKYLKEFQDHFRRQRNVTSNTADVQAILRLAYVKISKEMGR